MRIINTNPDKSQLQINISSIISDKELFFDIETTGLSGKYHQIYMIGCLFIENNEPIIRQYFCDTLKDESLLLSEFNQFCSRFDTLVSFNGDQFDIPFLIQRMKTYDIKYHFDSLHSVDLYKIAKKYRHLLNTPDLKLKSIEFALGYNRIDLCSGKELIDTYKLYESNQSDSLFQELILHNYEDILGMTHLLSLYSISQINLDIGQYSAQAVCQNSFEGELITQLIIDIKMELSISTPISYKDGDFYITINTKGLHLAIAVKNEQVKIPYFNYKDYVYLPNEDIAIPISLASSIDKTSKIKCSKGNCYGKYKVTSEFFSNQTLIKNYATKIVTYLLNP